MRLNSLSGNYQFADGRMLLRKSRIASDLGDATATEKINLVSKTLDVDVTANLGKLLPITVHAGGSLKHPRYNLSSRSALAPVNGALYILKKTLKTLPFPQ